MIRLTTLSLLTLSLLALPAAAQVGDNPTVGSNGSFVDRFAAHAPLSQRPTGPALKPAVTIVGDIVRIGDLIENRADDVFHITQKQVRIACGNDLHEFGFDHELSPPMVRK